MLGEKYTEINVDSKLRNFASLESGIPLAYINDQTDFQKATRKTGLPMMETDVMKITIFANQKFGVDIPMGAYRFGELKEKVITKLIADGRYIDR
ncbi:MAG: hypothetical protein JW754_05830 [Candidatus Aenigmarchaeota archaeon]|nr:hypothetical protein [Candidatus Aenigmarchaeota archaeon]